MKKIFILIIISIGLIFSPKIPQSNESNIISNKIEFQGYTTQNNPFLYNTRAEFVELPLFNTVYNYSNNYYIFNGVELYIPNSFNILKPDTEYAVSMTFNQTLPAQFMYYLSVRPGLAWALNRDMNGEDTGMIARLFYNDGSYQEFKNIDFFKRVNNPSTNQPEFPDNNGSIYYIYTFSLNANNVIGFEFRFYTADVLYGNDEDTLLQLTYGNYSLNDYSNGYQEGKAAGFNEGYDIGKLDASNNISEALFGGAWATVELVFRSLIDFFSVEIIQNVNVGLLVLGIPAIFTILGGVITLVRKFLGGS